MHVLDHDQARLGGAGPAQKRGQHGTAPRHPGRRVHGLDQGLAPRGGPEVEQVVEQRLVDVGQPPGLLGGDRRISALGLAGAGGRADQAAGQGTDRVLALARAEIEHQGLVHGVAARPRVLDQPLDKSALADAGLAAHDDDLTGAGAAGVEDGACLPEFGGSPDERGSNGRDVALDRAAEAPGANGARQAAGVTEPASVSATRPCIRSCTSWLSSVSPGPASSSRRAATLTDLPTTV